MADLQDKIFRFVFEGIEADCSVEGGCMYCNYTLGTDRCMSHRITRYLVAKGVTIGEVCKDKPAEGAVTLTHSDMRTLSTAYGALQCCAAVLTDEGEHKSLAKLIDSACNMVGEVFQKVEDV